MLKDADRLMATHTRLTQQEGPSEPPAVHRSFFLPGCLVRAQPAAHSLMEEDGAEGEGAPPPVAAGGGWRDLTEVCVEISREAYVFAGVLSVVGALIDAHNNPTSRLPRTAAAPRGRWRWGSCCAARTSACTRPCPRWS